MASPGDLEPAPSRVPATKVELTVSCRSNAFPCMCKATERRRRCPSIMTEGKKQRKDCSKEDSQSRSSPLEVKAKTPSVAECAIKPQLTYSDPVGKRRLEGGLPLPASARAESSERTVSSPRSPGNFYVQL